MTLRTSTTKHALLAGLTLLIAAPEPSHAQSAPGPRELPVQWILNMEQTRAEDPLAVHPGGEWVAVTLQRRSEAVPADTAALPALAPSVRGAYVSLVHTRTGARRSIRPESVAAWGPVWAPDGKRIALLSSGGKAVNVWIYDLATGRAHRAVQSTGYADEPISLAWHDSSLIVVSRGATPLRADTADAVATAPAFVSVRMSGLPVTAAPRRSYYAVVRRLQADGTLAPIDSGDIEEIAVAPRGALIAIRARTGSAGRSAVRVLSLATGERVIGIDSVPSSQWTLATRTMGFPPPRPTMAWAATGQRLAVVAGTQDTTAIAIADVPSRRVGSVLLPSDVPGLATNMVWTPDGGSVFVAGGHQVIEVSATTRAARSIAALGRYAPFGGRLEWLSPARTLLVGVSDTTNSSGVLPGPVNALLEIDVRTGQVVERQRGARSFGGRHGSEWGAGGTGRSRAVVHISEAAYEPPALWFAGNGSSRPRVLARWNPVPDGIRFGERRIVQWNDRTGRLRRGVLLMPPDAAGPVPVAVWLYWNATSRANVFGTTGSQVYNGQMLATRGIAVFSPDVEWKAPRLLDGIADIVLPGIDSLIAWGIADSTRIGLMGHSSGGFSVMALAVSSKLFRTAVVSSGWGTTDMMSMYLTDSESRAGPNWVTFQMGLSGTPWTNADVHVQNSPGYRLHHMSASLLILQGPVGDAVGARQSDQLFTAMRRLGRRAEYRLYEREGHSPDLWSGEARADAARRIVTWMVEELGQDDVRREVAPR